MNRLAFFHGFARLIAIAAFFTTTLLSAQAAPNDRAAFLEAAAQRPGVLYTLELPDGQSGVIYKNGIAKIYSADFSQVETRVVPGLANSAPGAVGTPSKAQVKLMLSRAPRSPYLSNEVVVVFNSGVHGTRDVVDVSATRLAATKAAKGASRSPAQPPAYTNNAAVNAVLAHLGVDRSERLFRQASQGQLHAMSENAAAVSGRPQLDISNVYELHVTAASVPKAVTLLRQSGAVVYASPAFRVATMHSLSVPVKNISREAAQALAVHQPQHAYSSSLPSNYALQSSLQSLLNTPGLSAAAAYDEIVSQFHQLPGTGEIITNVSIGDIDDGSTGSCAGFARYYGPTTIVQDGQHYIDWPSMPLIAAYTADQNGNLDGMGTVCQVDPYLDEVGLDFSMMAPLPHDQQRAGEVGTGVTDLLGIAPGATYRLVVPHSSTPTQIDIIGALLGAALQQPRPDVITASLGFGEDIYGFPGRYLEDDPLTASVIAAIVNQYHIVVCISSNDGLRTYTNAAVSPSGGSAPTDLANGDLTRLSDIFLSTAPSRDPDTGSIDVGGTTLDDIFAAPPQNPAFKDLKSQHAFAETRFTGFTSFSSGYGSRVNVSAPSDNVISFEHELFGAADAVRVVINGGTSASAPEVAASAAVVMQVARLTGSPFAGPRAVREFLEKTGTPVPKVPQSDVHNHVGPQVNLRRAVETLLTNAHIRISRKVARVAIEQRRGQGDGDAVFQSDTDPAYIDLTGANANAWITIAPDWEGVPDDAKFELLVQPAHGGAPDTVLASTRWARLSPQEILAAAGMPFAADESRTVHLIYRATGHGRPLDADVTLTFGPTDTQSSTALAPNVPPVVHDGSIPVSYDLGDASGGTLVVSEPGRVTPYTGAIYHPAYTASVGSSKGTVNVPLNALEGGGIYGIGIQLPDGTYSDFAFTRVQPAARSAGRHCSSPALGCASPQAPAPLLSLNGSVPGHLLEIPYGSSFELSWDVSNVPGATGAMLEVSAAGPVPYGTYALFNNPGGSQRDDNGVDTGSAYYAPLPGGTSGTATLTGTAIGLVPTLFQNVRVVPVAGGTVVGEASNVSTITMDGVVPADGGYIAGVGAGGFGINGHGSDGFITSNQQDASGGIMSSLEIFDQATNAITATIISETGQQLFAAPFGIYGNDIGLYGTGSSESFAALNTVSDGQTSAWTPPLMRITDSATNQDSGTGFFIALKPSFFIGNQFRVFTSNIADNTFGPLIDVTNALHAFLPDYMGIAEDTSTHTGVLVGGSVFLIACIPPTIVTVDLDTGGVSSFPGVGAGNGQGVAVDSVTGKAAVPTNCGNIVGIYDLASRTATASVALPGEGFLNSGTYTVADPVHHLFLIAQTVPPDVDVNNNSLSSIYLLDEQGNIRARYARFSMFNTYFGLHANNLQINPETRTGYTIGLSGAQLEPFIY